MILLVNLKQRLTLYPFHKYQGNVFFISLFFEPISNPLGVLKNDDSLIVHAFDMIIIMCLFSHFNKDKEPTLFIGICQLSMLPLTVQCSKILFELTTVCSGREREEREERGGGGGR